MRLSKFLLWFSWLLLTATHPGWTAPPPSDEELRTQEQEIEKRIDEIFQDVSSPREQAFPAPAPDPLILEMKPDVPLALSLEQALRLSWQQSTQVQQADALVRKAYWHYRGSGAPPPANIGLAYQYGHGPGYVNTSYSGFAGDDYYLFLTQSSGPLGSLDTSERIALHQLAQAQLQARHTRIQQAKQVKDGYFTLVAATSSAAFARENLRVTEELLKAAELRLKVGTAPEVERLNALLQRNRAEQDLRLAETQVKVTQWKLSPLLGLPSLQPLAPKDDLPVPPAPLATLAYSELLARAQQSPRVKLAEDNVAQSRLKTVLSKQQFNPSLSLSSFKDLVNRSNGLNIQLGIPLDWGGLSSDVEESLEDERVQALALTQEQRALTSELRVAFENVQATARNVQDFEEKVLRPAERTWEIYRMGYSRGVVPYLQLLTIQQQLASARKDYIDRKLELRLALNDLEMAVGEELSNAPHVPTPGT